MKQPCQIRFEALDAYQYGMMNPAQRKQLQSHIGECEECRERLLKLATESMEIGIALRCVARPETVLPARELVKLHVKRQNAAALARQGRFGHARTLVARMASSSLRTIGTALTVSYGYARGHAWVRHATLVAAASVAIAVSILIVWEEQDGKQRDLLAQAEMRFWRTQHDHLAALAQMNERLREEIDRRLLEQRALNKELQKEHLQSSAEVQLELRRLANELTERQQQSAELARTLEAGRGELQQMLRSQQEDLADLAARLKANIGPAPGSPPAHAASAPPPRPSLQLMPDDSVTVAWNAGEPGDTIPLTKNGLRFGWARRMTTSAALIDGIQAGANVNDLKKIVAQVPKVLDHGSVSLVGPAALQNRVFTGSGWGGNQVYALDAVSGEEVWSYTADDAGVGPVVVTDKGYVSFSTESCTVYVLDAKNGHRRWSRYLSSHAMTQPAIEGANMYVVHPADNGGRGVRVPGNAPYSLTCLSMNTGNVLWARGVGEDAITSPVVHGEKIYLTTRDGQAAVFDAKNGKPLWSQSMKATSAPAILEDRMYVSSWQRSTAGGFEERLLEVTNGGNARVGRELFGPFAAHYLLPMQPERIPFDDYYDSSDFDLREKYLQSALSQRSSAPVQPHVWQHMGARPLVVGNRLYAMVGDQLGSVDVKTGRTVWSLEVSGRSQRTIDIGSGQAPLTPPAYAAGKLYMGSLWGDFVCVDADTGKLLWRRRLANSLGVTSQIVLDGGRMYASTRDGLLVGIDTGDPDATGWSSWGGTADHNSAIPDAKAVTQPEKQTVRL